MQRCMQYLDIYIQYIYMWYIYAWCTCILPGWLWKMKLRFNRQSMSQIRSRRKNCTLHRNRRPLPRKLSIYKSRDSSKSGFPSTPTTCFQPATATLRCRVNCSTLLSAAMLEIAEGLLFGALALSWEPSCAGRSKLINKHSMVTK